MAFESVIRDRRHVRGKCHRGNHDDKFHQNFVASVAERIQIEKSRIAVSDKDGKILHVKGVGNTEAPVSSI